MKVGVAYGSMDWELVSQFGAKVITHHDKVEDFDLIAFTGGSDVSRSYYMRSVERRSYRDVIEMSIMEQALKLNKHVFGICRGHQLVNIALGGRLVTDIVIEGFLDHDYIHDVVCTGEEYPENLTNTVEKLLSLYPKVNSLHHQGFTAVQSKSVPLAEHADIVELAISDRILTTQFHPEMMDNFGRGGLRDIIEEWINGEETELYG